MAQMTFWDAGEPIRRDVRTYGQNAERRAHRMDHRRGVRLLEGRRRWWACARAAAGVTILVLLVWRLGTDAFLEPLQAIDGWPLAAAAAIAVPTTVASAWRWRLVSRGLGNVLPLRTAVAAYYRSQLLNTVLPGGVLGDVHRAVRHGRDVGDLVYGVRSVAWERTTGQAVQVGLTLVVLLALPSPLRPWLAALAAAVAAVTLCAVLVGRAARGGGTSALVRIAAALAADLRDVLGRGAWRGIVLASTVVVTGHVGTFLLAARTVGSTASLRELLPLALLVLLAAALPTSIAGWGPREGASAWLFAIAGLGAAQGVAVAVMYGVMALVSVLPGAVVMVVTWRGRNAGAVEGDDIGRRRSSDPLPSVTADAGGAARG